jgi:predicted nucleic acid-binding protein
MSETKQLLTLDSNIFVGAMKGDEPLRRNCLELISTVPESFFLSEPSIIYREVCGTIARRVGIAQAREFSQQLDRLISLELVFDCDRSFCLSSCFLCSEYGIYATDALYLSVAINTNVILVSMDGEDFIDKLTKNHHNIEAYHVSAFPIEIDQSSHALHSK